MGSRNLRVVECPRCGGLNRSNDTACRLCDFYIADVPAQGRLQ